MLYDSTGFSLALGLPERGFKAHIGVGLDDAEAVRAWPGASKRRQIVEQWDEPDYVSVKCRDPDGHIVEFSWETA